MEEGWRPPPTGNEAQSVGDVALLEVDKGLGRRLSHFLSATEGRRRHRPSRPMASPRITPESNEAEGVLGRPVGLEWLRFEQQSDALVEPGFSGAAIWSDEVNGRHRHGGLARPGWEAQRLRHSRLGAGQSQRDSSPRRRDARAALVDPRQQSDPR